MKGTNYANLFNPFKIDVASVYKENDTTMSVIISAEHESLPLLFAHEEKFDHSPTVLETTNAWSAIHRQIAIAGLKGQPQTFVSGEDGGIAVVGKYDPVRKEWFVVNESGTQKFYAEDFGDIHQLKT